MPEHTRHVAEPLVSAPYARISWSAILAGVVLALVIQFLINLLGLGIGTAVLDPVGGDNPEVSTFSIGSGVWFILSGIIASFAGGVLASRVSGRPGRMIGALHGLTMWAVATCVILYLFTTSIGALVGGAFSGISSVVSGAASTVATTATATAPALANAKDPFGQIERAIRTNPAVPSAENVQAAAVSAMKAVVSGSDVDSEKARTEAAQALAQAKSIPLDQARTEVTQYEQQYNDAVASAKKQAAEAAEVAANAASVGAVTAFVALVLGGVAAWFGGMIGVSRRTTFA